jgi:hypothetical protein
MNKQKLWASVAVLTLLLSGCAAKSASTTASDPSAATTAQGQEQTSQQQPQGEQGQTQSRPAMNEQQRQMMSTFQLLIRMDKQEALSITKDEAVQILPIVQDSVTKKELTDDQKSKLEGILTADQKKYVDDSAKAMKDRMGNKPNNKGGNSSPRPNGDKSNPKQDGQTGQTGQDNQNRPMKGGGGKNIGQQLVELLQSKSK